MKEPLPTPDVRSRKAMRELAVYFGLEATDAPDLHASLEEWATYAESIVDVAHRHESTISRVHLSASYVQRVHEQWKSCREEERDAKAGFLNALIEACKPALTAISGKMPRSQVFRPGVDEVRTHWDIHGFIVLDGRRRDVTHGDAGKSIVLLEDTRLALVTHEAEEVSPSGFQIVSTMRPVSVEEAVSHLKRDGFTSAVDHLVQTIWKLARSDKKKESIRGSLALADKLAAVRVLLDSSDSSPSR